MKQRLFSGGVGIINNVPPQDIDFDEKTGVGGFEAAMDVLINKKGKAVTRGGTDTVFALPCHSTWPTTDGFYMVADRDTDSALYKVVVNADGTVDETGIWAGLAKGRKFSYADLDDKVLYCNGVQHGQLDGATREEWPVNVWPRKKSNANKVATPIGSHIDVLSGRVLVAVDSEVFATVYGMVGIVDDVEDRRRFEGRVTMVASVQTGAFVSTTNAIYFVTGTVPRQWKVRKVANYPAIEHGIYHSLVDPSTLGVESKELSALFATAKGPVIGLPSGGIVNMVEKKLFLPSGCGVQTGSILVVDDSMIVQSGV